MNHLYHIFLYIYIYTHYIYIYIQYTSNIHHIQLTIVICILTSMLTYSNHKHVLASQAINYPQPRSTLQLTWAIHRQHQTCDDPIWVLLKNNILKAHVNDIHTYVLVDDWVPHLFIQFFSLFPVQHSSLHMIYICRTYSSWYCLHV